MKEALSQQPHCNGLVTKTAAPGTQAGSTHSVDVADKGSCMSCFMGQREDFISPLRAVQFET